MHSSHIYLFNSIHRGRGVSKYLLQLIDYALRDYPELLFLLQTLELGNCEDVQLAVHVSSLVDGKAT